MSKRAPEELLAVLTEFPAQYRTGAAAGRVQTTASY